MQLAAGEGWLEHVPSVHCSFGGAGADDCVQLVYEQDDVAFMGTHLVDHGFQPLFELTTVLGPRDEPGQVQHDDPLAGQGRRHVAVDDPLRDAFDDGRLAHAWIADQHWIVLGAAREHLQRLVDLVVAANDRIEPAFARLRREVAAILVERRGGAGGGAATARRGPEPLGIGHGRAQQLAGL